jgi:arylsulfatase A-like enzyme
MTGVQKVLPRHELYYHFYEYAADHTVLQHLGIRGERYKLIYFYPVNEWEMYDLQKDPAEQHNIYKDQKYAKILQQMKADLLHLRDVYDDHEKAGELN